MPMVSGADVRAILQFLDASPEGVATDPVPRSTLVALGELLHADGVEYWERGRDDRELVAYATTYPDDGVASLQAVAAYRHQNPMGWLRWLPADGPQRLSGLIGRRELQRLGWYQEVLKPDQIRDTLTIWLSSTPESVACVTLDRLDADFSQHDADLLGVLHQHLAAMRQSALARTASDGPASVALTPREAQVLTWAAWETNEEIGRRLFMSTATVRKHLEHAYEKLGVHSRAEAIARLVLSGPLD